MNLNEKFVLTIAREVGSGGRTVGRKVAEQLGVRYCDKTLIQNLVEQFGLSAAEIERIKGKRQGWLLNFFDRLTTAPRPKPYLDIATSDAGLYGVDSDEIFYRESEILKALAEESSCVIAGRSAFFVLEDHPNKVDIFLRASTEHRLARIMQRQNITRSEAEQVLEAVDEARERYVTMYADRSRYDLRNYDLVLNMDDLTEDKAAEIILQYLGR